MNKFLQNKFLHYAFQVDHVEVANEFPLREIDESREHKCGFIIVWRGTMV